MGFGSGQSTTNTMEEPAKLTPEKATPQDEEEESTSDEEDPVTVDKLSLQLDKISFGPSVNWNTMPQYKPIYLETESEHLPPPPKPKTSSKHAVEPSGKAGGGGEWGKEMWEDSKNVDDIFVRFTARLDARPKQCVR
jgi:pre-rRNA-processing protein TSR4